MIRKLILFAVFFALAPFTAEAKTIYVNNSGSPACSDSITYASNSASSPWCTLGRALWGNANRSTPNPGQAAVAGDTVLVTAGTYTAPGTGSRFGVAFNPVNSGTSESARIIIQAVGTVNLRSTGTAGGPIIGANAKSYITWDGFTVDETTYTSLESGEQSMCMFANGANYGTVKNCTLIGRTVNYANSNHSGIAVFGSSNAYIYNNTIYNVNRTGSDSNCAGIYSYGGSNILIEHNHIYSSTGGIFLKEAGIDTVTIRYNKLHDLVMFGIRSAVSDGANTNIVAYQNLIYNITAGYGFMNGYMTGSGNKFVNNTIYNVKAGFWISGPYSGNSVLWYNNILHTVATSAIYTEDYSASPWTYHDFQHNLYYTIPSNRHYSKDGGGFQTWNTWITTYGKDTISRAGVSGTNPLLTNIAGTDFRLCTAAGVPHASCSGSSPALTLGVDILNLAGRGTSAIIPAGAYITGNENIGTTTSLSPPPNFRKQ